MKYRRKGGLVDAVQVTKEFICDSAKWPAWLLDEWGGQVWPENPFDLDSKLVVGDWDDESEVVEWGDWIVNNNGLLEVYGPSEFYQEYESEVG